MWATSGTVSAVGYAILYRAFKNWGIFNGNTLGKGFIYLFIYILVTYGYGSYFHLHVTNEESRHDKIIHLSMSYSYNPSLNTNLDDFHP
jgi:hypothetical protein